ncbi:MAG: hypothetical protein ACQEP1_04645 [Nanobdellota archaeon]
MRRIIFILLMFSMVAGMAFAAEEFNANEFSFEGYNSEDVSDENFEQLLEERPQETLKKDPARAFENNADKALSTFESGTDFLSDSEKEKVFGEMTDKIKSGNENFMGKLNANSGAKQEWFSNQYGIDADGSVNIKSFDKDSGQMKVKGSDNTLTFDPKQISEDYDEVKVTEGGCLEASGSKGSLNTCGSEITRTEDGMPVIKGGDGSVKGFKAKIDGQVYESENKISFSKNDDGDRIVEGDKVKIHEDKGEIVFSGKAERTGDTEHIIDTERNTEITMSHNDGESISVVPAEPTKVSLSEEDDLGCKGNCVHFYESGNENDLYVNKEGENIMRVQAGDSVDDIDVAPIYSGGGSPADLVIETDAATFNSNSKGVRLSDVDLGKDMPEFHQEDALAKKHDMAEAFAAAKAKVQNDGFLRTETFDKNGDGRDDVRKAYLEHGDKTYIVYDKTDNRVEDGHGSYIQKTDLDHDFSLVEVNDDGTYNHRDAVSASEVFRNGGELSFNDGITQGEIEEYGLPSEVGDNLPRSYDVSVEQTNDGTIAINGPVEHDLSLLDTDVKLSYASEEFDMDDDGNIEESRIYKNREGNLYVMEGSHDVDKVNEQFFEGEGDYTAANKFAEDFPNIVITGTGENENPYSEAMEGRADMYRYTKGSGYEKVNVEKAHNPPEELSEEGAETYWVQTSTGERNDFYFTKDENGNVEYKGHEDTNGFYPANKGNMKQGQTTDLTQNE